MIGNRREMMTGALVLAASTQLGTLTARAAAATAAAYETVYYQSGKVKIEAYLYRPMGTGPFPLVIYNHGARSDEKTEAPSPYIGSLMTGAGYAALVVEGPGYGKSEGTAARSADPTSLVPAADDVIAAVTYLKTLDFIDTKRLGIMGWSLGGAISLFALSRSNAFKVGVDQAGASLNWTKNTALQTALVAATGKVKVPVYFMDCQNDATINSVMTCAGVEQKNNIPHKLTIYPPFFPKSNPDKNAAGHQLFTAEGVGIWGNDVVAFLNDQLMPTA